MKRQRSTRRRFLRTAAASSAAVGLGEFSLWNWLRPVSAAEARLDPSLVRFGPDIEPTVRLLEETPRDEIIAKVVARIRDDLSYPQLLAALLLAGIRNIPGASLASHRNVGGAMHTMLMVNSAHLASLSSPDRDRWLPILWAIDRFKESQARPIRAGRRRRPEWQMNPVEESSVPTASGARRAFIDAMENWDEEAADPAAAGLARTAGAHEVFDLLCRYGARDFRYIGHKAIYVSNAWRSLQCVGWRHAEPVLRSLARALTAYFHDQGHPARSDQEADRPWRENRELATSIRKDWQEGTNDPAVTRELLAGFREADDARASREVAKQINRGSAPGCLWDAIFLGVAELLMNRPGFDSLHAVTTANAIHFAYRTTLDDVLRRRMLLQAAAFVPMFRSEMAQRRGQRDTAQVDLEIAQFEPRGLDDDAPRGIDEIFDDVSRDALSAAGKTLTYLGGGGDPKLLFVRARQLVFLKGHDPHDYKFSSAVFEDAATLSPVWRDRFLAAAMFQLRGAGEPDTKMARRIQALS